MKKSMVAVFLCVLVWFVIGDMTGVGRITIYTVSDFISPFYVQLGDIILYLLFATAIYTTGIFIYHLYTHGQEKKDLSKRFDNIRNTIRRVLMGERAAGKETLQEPRAEALWNTAKTDTTSMYADIFLGLSEEDLKSKQDFLNACEIRVQDISAQKKRVLSFYNYIGVTAPTLGFLGTAVGMVAIFDDVGVAGAQQLGADLKIALITTVVGLAIRFAALFCKTIMESLQDDLSLAVVSDLKEILA